MIRSGRHPHEVMFLVTFALSGISGLFGPERTANSVLRALPLVGLYVFYGVFTVGCLLALAGVFTKGLKGPVIEMYGLGVLSLQLFGYGLAVFGFAGEKGALSGLFPICMALANAWRMSQVWGDIKKARLPQRRSEGA